MRVGYFGGSFDPPHRGHLLVACAARDTFALDRVLLAPTGRQPLKPDGAAASFVDRLQMTSLLCAEERALEASNLDAPQVDDLPNYTADTLRRLRLALPGEASLFAIVGADAFLGLPQWHEAAALFFLAEWIVVSRPGVEEERLRALPLTPAQWARTHLLGEVEDPTSATDLRARLRSGQNCAELLPFPVLAYIREHGLYAEASSCSRPTSQAAG